MDAKQALDRLIQGNERYVRGELEHPNRDIARREATKSWQNPFAIILGCADSRVSPEILFDQGIGDLFIVRVAGNVCGPIELDSIQFSAITFGSSVILVLGHKNCGAVTAVVTGDTKKIATIASLIQPAVEQSACIDGDCIENAIRTNVSLVVAQLKRSPVIAELVAQGKLIVVGGYYDLETGRVDVYAS